MSSSLQKSQGKMNALATFALFYQVAAYTSSQTTISVPLYITIILCNCVYIVVSLIKYFLWDEVLVRKF